MNLVWPITALYWGPVAVWLYYRTRTRMGKAGIVNLQSNGDAATPPTAEQLWVAVGHCIAGCVIGEVIAETTAFVYALAFIAGSRFVTRIVLDFILAFVIGIAFQYFSIVPMKHLSPAEGIKAAVRADTISITAFEIGMLAWMAVMGYVLFPASPLQPDQARFWFMMQIAMVIGFLTSLPANKWLILHG